MIFRVYDISIIESNSILNESIVKYNNDGTFNRIQINDIPNKVKKYDLNKLTTITLNEFKGNTYKIIETNDSIVIDKKAVKEYVFSEYSKKLKYTKKLIKSMISKYINDFINYSSNKHFVNYKNPKHIKDAKYGFYKYSITFSLINDNKESFYQAILLVRNDANEKKYLYDILDIKKINQPRMNSRL